MKSLCVYCGSSQPKDSKYVRMTEELGSSLHRHGYGLVYGGASTGLMGVLAKTVMASGAPVCGVIPHLLGKREINEIALTEIIKVDSMSERKLTMAKKASAFLALPGGIGTMDELCECLSWSSLGLHRKPVALYNYDGYYDKLLTLFDEMVQAGFMRESFRQSIIAVDNPEDLFQAFEAYQPPVLPDWVDERYIGK